MINDFSIQELLDAPISRSEAIIIVVPKTRARFKGTKEQILDMYDEIRDKLSYEIGYAKQPKSPAWVEEFIK